VTLGLTGRARLRVLLIAGVTLAGLGILIWGRTRQLSIQAPAAQSSAKSLPNATLEVPSTPSPLATSTTNPSPSPSALETPPRQVDESPSTDQPVAESFVGKLNLIIPVAGVKPGQLLDTFADARSEGRVHDAIDIPAPAGTPVLAAADGEILKLFQSERGGTTIYQLSVDRKLVFYYAHLQGYADGLAPGKFVRQGEVIAYVGDTGNAGAGNFHLHFSIAIVPDPKRYWEGTNINPYPLLRQ
jgi:murein DD-endopeptidase MepM/ murein hydrolase activator NlpD